MLEEHPPKKLLVIVGQTPPPWHGQAVATQMLFEAPWDRYDVRTIRMAFSSEMEEVGRVNFRKAIHILDLWKAIRQATHGSEDGILIYPPASPNWVPVLRDLIFLPWVRSRFRTIVYLYHAGGFGEWCIQSRFRRWIVRCAYGVADLSLEVAREETSPHQVMSARSWAWTPYGVQVPPVSPQTKHAEGRKVVLFVGSLQEGKGVLEVIKTAAILKSMGKEGEFLFRIVGRWFSGTFEAEALQMRSAFKLEEMVEFPGQLTGDAKWKAYAEADIFFFPTHYSSEAFPLVLIEALGSGLPVLTTRWRGIPDLFDGCPVAKLCATRAPEEYVEALLAFQKLAKEGVDFGSAARKFYKERYLPEHFLTQVESLVSGVALGIQKVSIDEGNRIAVSRTMAPIPCEHNPDLKEEATSDPCDFEPSSQSSSLLAKDKSNRASAEPNQTKCESRNGISENKSGGELVRVSTYLADQNPGFDRSFGISRMTQMVMRALHHFCDVNILATTSKTSQRPELDNKKIIELPWGTRSKFMRFFTDHFHPLFGRGKNDIDVHFYPKGYLPFLSGMCRPSVVTVHDTIIQYDQDHYPKWRSRWEYAYWSLLLRHTLRKADRILTVSESSREQIRAFMARHKIPAREITVTYEPCAYENVAQPNHPAKGENVIHLASVEPHKRTAHLIRWWYEAEVNGKNLPTLHLIGSIPPEVLPILSKSKNIVKHPFLEDHALQDAYKSAKALILPSEIEGFGLPALEAYYLGTPVCFVEGTSVEEVLGVTTHRGGFSLESMDSMISALEDVMSMTSDEVRTHGLKLRETYASEKVAARLMVIFQDLAGK